MSVAEFDTSGTFVIPPFAKRVYVLLVGGGQGGVGGPQGTENLLLRSGGCGGGIFVDDLPVGLFGPPGTVVTVTIGAGSAGGAGATGSGTFGATPSAGGSSSIGINGKPGSFISIGSNTSIVESWYFGNYMDTTGANSSFAGLGVGGSRNAQQSLNAGGIMDWISNGGAGGGVTGGTGAPQQVHYSGFTAISSNLQTQTSPRYANGTVSGTYLPVIPGGSPNSPDSARNSDGFSIGGAYTPGLGGVGGGGSTTTVGGRGGNGWRGGGGGGGGGSMTGFVGGTGGNGGNGYCVLIAYG